MLKDCKKLCPPVRVDWVARTILIAVAVILIGLWIAPSDFARQAIRENGPIEMGSAILLGVGVIVAIGRLWRRPSWGWVSGTAMTFWGVLRELDFQKRFTYRSVESTGFYFRDIAPLHEKLIAAGILLPFAIAGFHLLWLAKTHVPAAARRRERWVGYLAFLFLSIAVAQFSEKVLGAAVTEEVVELGLAAFTVALITTVSLKADGEKTKDDSERASKARAD